VSNGSFYQTILNNSNYAKVMIFSQNGPPRENSINLSANEVNITVISMGDDKGFRKFNESGGLEEVDTTSMPISMRFLRNTEECGVPNAPSSTCLITEMNASSFNPLKALLAGKVNMEIKMTNTNVSLIFHNYDMMSAKQPPMMSILEENASARATTSGSSAVSEVWNFGSFAPSDSYANVTIVMPYSDVSSAGNYINDSAQVNVTIPALYDENQNIIWNSSRGDNWANLSEEFLEYNKTSYRQLLNSSGYRCYNNTGLNESCFNNITANYIALKVPHFSTLGALVTGQATTATATTTTSSSSGGGGGGASYKTYEISTAQLTEGYTKALAKNDRVKTNVSGEWHYVIAKEVNETKGIAVIEVQSEAQNKTFKIGQGYKFDVNNDGYYDFSVLLEGITNNKAEVKISKAEGAVETITGEEGTAKELTNEEKEAITTTGEETANKWYNYKTNQIIAGAILLIIIGIIIYAIIKKTRTGNIKKKR
ncbi:hypothetical protein COU61_00725, partial [Candidatus Pacearchaeota archaeon CG10_big_fil_rev_8_21_14_0_10_35_13]